jgi:hypothetical protein
MSEENSIGIVEVYSDGQLFVQCNEAGHNYTIGEILWHDADPAIVKHMEQHLSFQNGPIKESGINGVQNEPIIAILIDRLEFLDRKFPSDFNKNALMHLRFALTALQARTSDRVNRGVEGTNVV